jgi:HAE1 family hydrophobic/amphiphilic exporter-1
VDVVVFLPMSLVSGLIGNIVREFSLVVVFSTLMSLFVSFTITPMLASRFGKIDHFTNKTLWGRISLGFERLFTGLQNAYARILGWSLGHRWVIYVVSLTLFVGTIALVPAGFIGSEFTAQGDRGELVVALKLDPQVTLYQNNQVTRQVETLIKARPEVKLVLSQVGRASGSVGTSAGTNNRSEITVILVDKKDRSVSTEGFGAQIKEEIRKIPGVRVKAAPTSITGNANQAPIQIVLKGTELAKVQQAATTVLDVVKTVPGATDVEFSVEDPNPELQVHMDRERLAALGFRWPTWAPRCKRPSTATTIRSTAKGASNTTSSCHRTASTARTRKTWATCRSSTTRASSCSSSSLPPWTRNWAPACSNAATASRPSR